MHNGNQSIRLMVLSLGGTSDPIIKSLKTYCPDKVVFFVSQASVVQLGEVLAGIDFKPEHRVEITEDPNLLSECYGKARRCIEFARQSGFSVDEVMVDYTGGTKVMSAALLMAGACLRCRFNYVGGDLRDKDGVGVVRTGHERLFAEMSPWAVWAEEERAQVKTLFNQRRFGAVMEIVDATCRRGLSQERIRRYFQFVVPAAEGLLKWDQFEIRKAAEPLRKSTGFLRDYLAVYPSTDLEDFAEQLQASLGRVQSILEKTKGLSRPHSALVADLLNNARRKMADQRNDDAAARVYRALELHGQICFRETAGCDNGAVDPEIIPEGIRSEFVQKYMDPDTGKLKLPLQATFRYLETCGHESGRRFFRSLEEVKKIQYNRNNSILAHGIAPIGDRAAASVLKTVVDFVGFADSYDFPRLP